MSKTVKHLGFGLAIALGAAGCSRGGATAPQNPPATPATPHGGTAQVGGSGETGHGAPPAVGDAPSGAARPTTPAVAAGGPRTQLTGEHYSLEVVLGPPANVPGESTMTVEIRGTAGFHVNERAPVGLDLTATDATVRAQWRAADATERSQTVASFRIPVQVTGAGATVRGTARAVVCRTGEEGVCEFVTREFGVGLAAGHPAAPGAQPAAPATPAAPHT